MESLENLTDAQLRTKLAEHGFPSYPITGTTRKIMIKKLKLLMETKSKAQLQERRTLGKFSSDDDSDKEFAKETRSVKTRRATAQVNGNQRENDKRTVRIERNVQKEKEEKKESLKKSRIVLEVRHLSGDVSSDTEPEIVYEFEKKSKRKEPQPQVEIEDGEIEDTEEENSLGITMKSFTNTPNTSSTSTESPPKLFTTEPRRHTSSVQRPTPIVAPIKSRYSGFQTNLTRGDNITSTPSDHEQDYDDALRQKGNSNFGYCLSNEDLLESTPYLRNFNKRLSALTNPPSEFRPESFSSRFKRLKANGVNVNGNPAESSLFSRMKQKVTRIFQRRSVTTCRSPIATTSLRKGNKGNLVSVALIIAVGVFFAIILALYYGMHRGINTNDIVGLKVPFCSEYVTENCLTQEEAEGGIELYRIFKPKLIELAIDYQCGDEGQNTNKKKKRVFMTDEDIVQFIKSNYKLQDEEAIIQDVDNFVLIAHYNQFLGVSVLKVDRNHDGESFIVVENEDIKKSNLEIESGNSKYIRALAVLSPTLPWKCSFYQKFTALIKGIITIFIVATIMHFISLGIRWLRYYQQRNKEEVVMFVEKIIEIMQTQAEEDQFLVINHIRDMIIPINSRKKMEKTWKKAIAFINENESRIRTEIQIVKGESYEVWRWIGGQNVSINTGSPSKSWQGQAFEVQAGGVNAPPCSPTPCLKIRGMIDDADRGCNKLQIRDAILSKCGPQCRVLHLSVDVQSKCVYLKCSDTNDAAIAYRNLHGQWFAGHLVTVKYLRLERYMQRFPDSPQSGPPFLKVGGN